MKKIIKSLGVIAAMSVIVVGATRAYFSDTETSAGNVFIAGTIDLGPITSPLVELTDIKPSQTLKSITVTFENVGNNEGTLEFSWSYVENDKIVDGYCDPVQGHYFEFWAGPGTDTACSGNLQSQWEMTADDFAKLVYVTASTQDGFDNLTLLTQWADVIYGNNDGKVSLYELAHTGGLKWYRMDGNNSMTTDDTLGAGGSTTIVITFHMGDAFSGELSGWPTYEGNYSIIGDTAWNVPQADGINATITATLSQVGAPTPTPTP